MALITMNDTEIKNGIQFLESVVITDQATATVAVTRGVHVPVWATKAIFTIFYDSATGTTPTFDFVLGEPDWGSLTLLGSPTDATDKPTLGNAAWDGITQLTGAGPYIIKIEVGPDVTDDDTGSATANCTYGVKTELPPVITYTYTTDGTSANEDYTFRLAVQWKA